jgi:flagellar motor protein MotB
MVIKLPGFLRQNHFLIIYSKRPESDGPGETQPVVPNDIPVNKALNRRVEFIKL